MLFGVHMGNESIQCVRCGTKVPSSRELYAVCQRASVNWEGGDVEGVVFGIVSGIPFVLPSGFSPSVKVREGEDVVIQVPLPVCDDCWNRLDGGRAYRLLSIWSQIMFTAGVSTLLYLLFARLWGKGISFLWPLGFFACALPAYFIADRIRSHWEDRLKQYMRFVSSYDELLYTFPDLELYTSRPTALMGDSEH